MNYEKLQNLPIDPVLVQRIQSNPTMCAEQGEGFMEDYGGPSNYVELAKLPGDQRLVMAAKMDGFTLPSDIAVVTGLTEGRVNVALNALSKGGVISEQDVSPLE